LKFNISEEFVQRVSPEDHMLVHSFFLTNKHSCVNLEIDLMKDWEALPELLLVTCFRRREADAKN